ncbi:MULTISPECIES: hypothetical protein [Methylobacterium]|uniref:hypothetical protein n=1 Tax=Methylobacterium TaxID=407 RepID=UPI000EEB9E12|nr:MULTISPECIES: hypothetical protein [Methylobacterium]GBU18498.1 hypothetical protein AwMethylo_27130 [Methylobacterium sp.]
MSPLKAPRPRLTIREVLFVAFVAAWVLAVVMTDRAVPLTPPVVSYASAVSR